MNLQVTTDDYIEFIRFGKKVQQDFHLGDWDIVYCFDQLPIRKIATIEYDITTMNAKVSLNTLTCKVLIDNNENKFIRKKAFHEISHLLIGKLALLVDCSQNSDDSTLSDCEKHSIINRLINSFDKLKYFD